MNNVSTDELKRMPALDGLRGTAILMVVIWHYGYCSVAGKTPAEWWIQQATRFFFTGVDLFFVLSGFLIGRMLLASKGQPDFFRSFYIKRFCRILPVYYLSLTAYWLIAKLGITEQYRWLMHLDLPFWSYWVLVQNYFMGATNDFGPHWLAVTWSLAIEEQFYLLFPLLVYLLDARKLPIVFCIGIMLSPIFRSYLPGMHSFVALICRMDALLVGALIAYLYAMRPELQLTRSARFWWIMIATLGMVIIVAWWWHASSLKHSIFAVIYGTLLLLAIENRFSILSKILRLPALRFLGKYSYGLYLFHQMVIGFGVGMFLPNVLQPCNFLMDRLLSFLVALLFSVIVYHTIEWPMIQIGRKWAKNTDI